MFCRFINFEGFNDFKRKKNTKLTVPYSKESRPNPTSACFETFCVNWKDLNDDIEKLATTLSLYSIFLDNSNKEQQERQHKMIPSRQVERHLVR